MKKLQINWGLWVQGLLFIAAAILVFNAVMSFDAIMSGISSFFNAISPVIIAAVMAYILSRPCQGFEKLISKSNHRVIKKRARGLAVLLVYLLSIAIVYAVFRILIPLLFRNLLDFVDFIPELYTTIETFVLGIDWNAFDEIFDIQAAFSEFFSNFDIQTVLIPVTQGLGLITNIAISTVVLVFDVTLALIISIYMLLYKEIIFETIHRMAILAVKVERVETLEYYAKKADELFYKYIRAQFLDSCIMGAGSIIILAFLNVRFAVALGILLGVANMIPKFGSIIATVVVVALTLITGDINQTIWTAILLTIWQQIDGNIIGPMIMGDALKINPILVFVSLLVGAAYFGILGMFLSIPVITLMKIIVMNIVEAMEAKRQHANRIEDQTEIE